MKYALVNSQNIVVNVIALQNVNAYRAPPGLTVMQVNDWVQIGDLSDAAKPVPPKPPLPAARNGQIREIEIIRDTKNQGIISYNQINYKTDDNLIVWLNETLANESNIAPGTNFPLVWPTDTGSVSLSFADAKNVFQSYLLRKKQNFANYLVLEAAINSSTDPSSVDISTGWVN